MKLKQIGSNQTELHLDNGTIVLFSYETPVASYNIRTNVVNRTKTKYSRTTTKHINQWFDHSRANLSTVCKHLIAFSVDEVDQSVLDGLVNNGE